MAVTPDIISPMQNSSEVRFQITSTNPKVSAAELVSVLAKQVPDLQAELRLRKEFGDVSVEADRQKSVPIDPVTAWLILKFIGGAVAGGFLGAMGKQAFEFLKEHIQNGTVKEADEKKKTDEKK
jgi:hypothetical protein